MANGLQVKLLNGVGSILQNKNVSIWTNPKQNASNTGIWKYLPITDISTTITNLRKNSQSEILTGTGRNPAVNTAVNALLPSIQAAILDAKINESSKVPEHPLEDGSVIADNYVINPVEITIRLACSSYTLVKIEKEIDDLFRNKDFVSIRTKGGIYNDMVLQNKPRELTSENVDRVVFDLHFKQILTMYKSQVTQMTKENIAKADDANTVN
jgi:hypothetical protein